jgi:MFS family permease
VKKIEPAAENQDAFKDSRKGWPVVFAAMIGVALGMSPIPFYTIGMLAPQLSAEFGWSFTELMASISVQSIVVMVASPLAGIAIDRFGARVVGLASLPVFGLSYMSLALSNGSILMYYSQWVVMSLFGLGTLSATWTRVVTQWFDKWRGIALGVASCGTGITGFLVKPFMAQMIEAYGWRSAVVVVGLLPIVVGVPIVALMFRGPSVDAQDAVTSKDSAAPAKETGLTLKDALGRRHLPIMAVAFLLIAVALTAPTPNLENILGTRGFTLTEIGEITAAFGLAVIAGRLIGGWLLDRFWAPVCAVIIMAFPAAGCWLLTLDSLSHLSATLAVISLGFGAGFEFDLLAYLVSRYFGSRSYGAIYASLYSVIALAGAIGPVAFGSAFDIAGNYTMALRIASLSLLIGAVMTLSLGRYPKFTTQAEA